MELRQRLGRLHARREFFSALGVIERLQKAGFAAVLAGGSVRDSLLGRAVKDLDIATSAAPDEIESRFERTLAVGKAFGTIVVIEGDFQFEVTTFRREGPYLDGRHPDSIELTDMREDALRRDFTVNALFYDPIAEVVHDFVGGIEDLNNNYLRTVGVAAERFGEDQLRMLRAIRFVSQLGFSLDSAAMEAIRDLRHKLKTISVERVRAEVERLLMGQALIPALQVLAQTGLALEFWPEIAQLDLAHVGRFHAFNRWENAFSALMYPQDPLARLQAFKASRESQRLVLEQTRAVTAWLDPKTTHAARMRLLGRDTYADLLILLKGLDVPTELSPDLWLNEYLKIANSAGQLPVPFLNGKDLLANGLKPGAEFGRLIERAYDAQLEGELRTREQALDWLKTSSS